MRRLLPEPAGEVDTAELERLYDYPGSLTAPFVKVNFVSSVDGAAIMDGQSEGLSSKADKAIFALGRDLADVIMVGAGTATIEGYRGVKRTEIRAERRSRRSLSELPPIAVVTRSCSIPPDSPLITDPTVPTIIITCDAAPDDRRVALADAGADVIVAGDTTVDLAHAIDALAERSLLRINCEGGPQLFGELIAAGIVDELCLTVAPLLASGTAPRIAHGLPPVEAHRLQLASVLTEDDFLMLRYTR